jgi:hypothetical protein
MTPRTSTSVPSALRALLATCALLCLALAAVADEAPLEPLTGAPGAPGLSVRYYEGDFGTVLDLPDAKPVKETAAATIALPDYARPDEFGLEFYGAIEVPRDGDYTFFTTSDDGSRLYLGTRLIVQNDYPHGATEKQGTVTLKAGRYPIYVGYFEGVVDQVLEVAWQGPDIAKGPIPADALSQYPQVVTFPKDAVTKTELEWPDLGQRLTVIVDTREAPDLQALHQTIPDVLRKHYPPMLSILWTKGDPLPSEVRFQARPGIDNPAYASGNRIVLSAEWFARNPGDLGCLVHEMTHLVQRYPGFPGQPGWLVEGISDYVRYKVKADDRWAIPQSYREGTSYKNGYGVTTAFLVCLERHYGNDLVSKLNRSLKDATYTDALFRDLTGKPLDDLWEEYKQKSAEDAKDAA